MRSYTYNDVLSLFVYLLAISNKKTNPIKRRQVAINLIINLGSNQIKPINNIIKIITRKPPISQIKSFMFFMSYCFCLLTWCRSL